MIFDKSFLIQLGTTTLKFGWESYEVIPDAALSLGKEWCVLTTVNASGLSEVLKFIEKSAKDKGANLTHLNIIEPNPDAEALIKAKTQATECDVVIAIGGGSVLDAGKALAVSAVSDTNLVDLLDQVYLPDNQNRKKLILVPTTSGTGSELSFGAIISDRKRGLKGGIRGKVLAPDYAIVDPYLTMTVPRSVTAETGFDIFTHSFESLLSSKATTHSRANSIQCINLVGEFLPEVLTDLNNEVARKALSFASCMIGLNLSNIGTCLPHRLQYPIGGLLPESSHPQGLAWIYPTWVKYLYPHAVMDVNLVFSQLGLNKPKDSETASNIIRDWIESLGISTHPQTKLDPEQLTRKVQGNLAADPIPDPESKLNLIYSEIFQ